MHSEWRVEDRAEAARIKYQLRRFAKSIESVGEKADSVRLAIARLIDEVDGHADFDDEGLLMG